MDKIIIPVSEDFSIDKAVCNHGFFMMAPNNWDPSTKTLTRPLRLTNDDRTYVTTSIHQPSSQGILIVDFSDHRSKSNIELSWNDRQFIQSQVVRMLRLSREEDMKVQEFYKLNSVANQIKFGRIFRSPTLFEDMVKSILLCNCSWGRSLKMAEALCTFQHKLSCSKIGKKRKRWCDCNCMGNFPSSKEIVGLNVETLRDQCNLGYRAETVLELAANIENGTLNLDHFASPNHPTTSYHRLMKIKGFGSFVAANVMMCLGFYQYIPIDTETIKHLEQVHGKSNLKTKKARTKAISRIYDKFEPFQCLVYWMERVGYYEKQLGKLSELPNSRYANATSPTKKDMHARIDR